MQLWPTDLSGAAMNTGLEARNIGIATSEPLR